MRELSLSNCRIDKRYDVVDILGRGSYAEIFVARDSLSSPQTSHNQVVIKALNVFLQNDLDPDLERTLVENFQNEAVALDRVRHPNVISRLGHGTARDLAGTVFHYLVLEYMAGGDLQKQTRESQLSLKQALHYCEQVCAGLRHAHAQGIIHRDIKPQNLLLTKDKDVVKIADFGVARLGSSDAPITRVGTNVYAPPEHSPFVQAANGVATVAKLSPASDIYSLAKSMYAIITGESPRFYTGGPITDLPINWRTEEWAPELKRVLHRATQDDPLERPQTIEDFWTDLGELRRFAADFETATKVRPKFHATPQANVAKGYSPIAPQQARFNTSRELKLKNAFQPAHTPLRIDVEKLPFPPAMPPKQPMQRVENYWPEQQSKPEDAPQILDEAQIADAAARKRRRRKRLLAIAVVLVVFFGGLYATSAFLRSSGILSGISIGAPDKVATANTDINLRPEPSANSKPIGLVTKDSRVSIVKQQGVWYQVDVIEQGRELDPPLATNRGWLHGRYLILEDGNNWRTN